MRLVFGFLGGPWDTYLRFIGHQPNYVAVPLSASWQSNVNSLRVTTEARIRAQRGNIANTINCVQFLGDDGVMFFMGTVDSSNPASGTNRTEWTLLGNNCFTSRIAVHMFTTHRNSLTPIQGQIFNMVHGVWRQVRRQDFLLRAQEPVSSAAP